MTASTVPGMTRHARRSTALMLLAPIFVLFLVGCFAEFWIMWPLALILGVVASRLWGPPKPRPAKVRSRVRIRPMLFWRL